MFSSFSLTRCPHTLSLPFPSLADPLCCPANGGSAREDEGEESADRRAGHACNASQRKSLTPWAEAGKTVILFFFALPPRFLLSGSWAEPSWARAAEPTFVRKALSTHSGLLARRSSLAFVNEPSTSVLALSAPRLSDRAKLIYSAATLPHSQCRPGVIRQMLTLMFKLDLFWNSLLHLPLIYLAPQGP